MGDKDSILEDIKTEDVEAPYLQRLIATYLDVVIEVGIMVAFYFLSPEELIFKLIEISAYMKYFIVLVIVFAYRLICILVFGKTIGMKVCRLKYLNGNLEDLSLTEKLIAVFANRTSKIRYYKV